VSKGIQTILYPVEDMARAKAQFSTLLGAEPIADSAYYTGFKVAGQDIGLVPKANAQHMTGPLPYLHVDDIKASLAALLEGGAETLEEVKDVGGGRLVASVRDRDGNAIGLLQDAG
jgi:predicted enzyme related to lactoylglutathione lyase